MILGCWVGAPLPVSLFWSLLFSFLLFIPYERVTCSFLLVSFLGISARRPAVAGVGFHIINKNKLNSTSSNPHGVSSHRRKEKKRQLRSKRNFKKSPSHTWMGRGGVVEDTKMPTFPSLTETGSKGKKRKAGTGNRPLPQRPWPFGHI